MTQSKILLIDVDDCSIEWRPSFKKFAELQLNKELSAVSKEFYLNNWLGLSEKDTRELVNDFNDYHEDFENLPSYRKSEIYLPKIKTDLGYNISVITACSDKPETKVRRTKNLVNLFGDIFTDIHCVKDSPSKKGILEKYNPTFWIDDHYGNARMGANLGHKSYLIRQPYNIHYEKIDKEINFIDDWEQIYNILQSETINN